MYVAQLLLRICYEKVVSYVSLQGWGKAYQTFVSWCEGHLLNKESC